MMERNLHRNENFNYMRFMSHKEMHKIAILFCGDEFRVKYLCMQVNLELLKCFHWKSFAFWLKLWNSWIFCKLYFNSQISYRRFVKLCLQLTFGVINILNVANVVWIYEIVYKLHIFFLKKCGKIQIYFDRYF